MATAGAEFTPGNSGTEIDVLKQEVRNQTVEQIRGEVLDVATKAAEVKQIVDMTITTTGRAPDRFEGNATDKDSAKGKAVDTKKAVIKVLLAAKEPGKMLTPEGKPAAVTTLATNIIQKVSDYIRPADISEQTAPYLYRILNKAISGEIADIDTLAQEFENIKYLKMISPLLYENLQKSLIQVAKDGGLSEEQAKEKFGKSIGKEQQEASRSRGGFDPFEQAWQQYYDRYFDKEDIPLVEAIYKPEKFKQLVEEYKQKIREKEGITDADKLNELVSEAIERKIMLVFGKIYTKLDRQQPDQFFHEIVQQDFWRGIQTTTIEFTSALEKMARYLEKDPEAKTLNLKRRFEVAERAEEVEVELSDGRKVKRTKYRIKPLTRVERVSTDNFIRYIGVMLNHYMSTREYTHNVRAMFLRPAGEKGYYADLKQYSDKMTTTDLQEMLLLPDSDIFLNALWLYDRYVEAELAKWDWINQPDTFSPQRGEIYNIIEKQVLDALERMYPSDPEKFPDKDTRLKSALSMAVGASRGVFLNEPEKVSYADPQLDENGRQTFRGYYTKDSAALLALNPIHHPFRWQTEGAMSPILFMPIDDLSNISDHNELWDKMQKFRNSFLEGRKPLGEGQLFIDFLVNIGRVGGLFQRNGWRTLPVYEGYYKYVEGGERAQKLDFIKTWQQIENIGYEINKDFIDKRLLNADEKAYLMRKNAKGDIEVTREERLDFFKYLYKKYFIPSGLSFEKYWKKVEEQAIENVNDNIIKKKISPKNKTEEVELEACKIFLYRTLARIVAQRMPSKFLRIDRDRFSDDGTGRYKKIRLAMGLDPEEFDKVMKDLGLAETILRNEVSEKMRKGQREGKELGDIEVKYKLDKKKLETLLRLTGKSDKEIKQAGDLLEKIQEHYSENENFLNEFASFIKGGVAKYPFTFGLDDTDISFLMFKGGGQTVIPRSIGDISEIEQNVIKPLLNFPDLLHATAISGKHDFLEIVDMITKAKKTIDIIIGTDYSQEVAARLAAVAVNYFKKDTISRALMGIFGTGKKNSLAAEVASWPGAVWEWDSRETDAFYTALEIRRALPKEPYNLLTVKKIEYEPVYVKLPFTKNTVIKLPEKLFKQRKKDFKWSGNRLRKESGGDWKSKIYDILNRYGPLVIFFILWQFIKKANEEAEGKKH